MEIKKDLEAMSIGQVNNTHKKIIYLINYTTNEIKCQRKEKYE